jgi:hypothetical protein
MKKPVYISLSLYIFICEVDLVNAAHFFLAFHSLNVFEASRSTVPAELFTQSTLLKKSTNSLKFILSLDLTPAILIIAKAIKNEFILTVDLLIRDSLPEKLKDLFQVLAIYISFPIGNV